MKSPRLPKRLVAIVLAVAVVLPGFHLPSPVCGGETSAEGEKRACCCSHDDGGGGDVAPEKPAPEKPAPEKAAVASCCHKPRADTDAVMAKKPPCCCGSDEKAASECQCSKSSDTPVAPDPANREVLRPVALALDVVDDGGVRSERGHGRVIDGGYGAKPGGASLQVLFCSWRK